MLFYKYTILTFFIISHHILLASEIEVPQFEMPDEIASTEGHIKLEWSSPNNGEIIYEVEAASSSDFESPERIYKGPDLASFISGKPNGTYYYRVRAMDASNADVSEWSDSVQFTVEHHPIELALTLAGIGTLVFLLTAFVVIRGANKQEQPNEF